MLNDGFGNVLSVNRKAPTAEDVFGDGPKTEPEVELTPEKYAVNALERRLKDTLRAIKTVKAYPAAFRMVREAMGSREF